MRNKKNNKLTMSNTFKKVISLTTSVTTIAWLSGVAALAPLAASAAIAGIVDGDTVKVANNPDVYIVKYVGAKQFKRLILSPSVFNSYQHLSWSKIKTISQANMDALTTSTLVRAVGDPKVYSLVPTPNSDNGSKQWVNMSAEAFTAAGYDWDAIYTINATDRDVYTPGADITGGTSSSPSTTVTPGQAGTVTVSLASDTPAAGVAPGKAARVPFLKFGLTAGATEVRINAITAQRTGLADDAALSSIALIDNQTNLQVGLNQTLNASHQVVIREAITIPANTTKYYTLAANMLSTVAAEAAYAGQVAALSLVAVETSATVAGTLPITGNGQTINGTLTIGTVSGLAGSLNGGSTTTKAVGTTGYNFSAIKLTAGSAEDVTVYSIRWNQSGSAAASDLANVVVSDGTTNYATTVSSDGKYYAASFGTAGITIGKGLSKEFTIKADIVGGSARTIKFDIYRTTDIVVKGNTFGYYLTLDSNTTNPFNTGTNPIFMGSTITVSSGTLRVDKSASGAPAANITIGATGQILGAFDFVVQGEAVNVTSIAFNIATTTAGNKGLLTNLTLAKADGSIIAGPVNTTFASAGNWTVTFSGTVSFPVGTTQVILKGNLDTNWSTNDTIIASLTPSSAVTNITGATTGNAITATPASSVSANTMTVKAGALTVSVSGTPVSQTVIRGVTGYTFANYIFDASASGEDVKVTTIALYDTMAGSADVSQLSSMQLWDGATSLNNGSNVVSLTGTASASFTFTLDVPLIIPKGTQKVVALKGNISGTATVGSSHAWGLAASAAISSTGMSTTLEIGETVNNATGSVMTVAAGGQYSVTLDSSTPTGKLIPANTTGNVMTVLKFYATSEQINVTKIRLSLNNASSSGNDLSQVYIYDGSTLLGQGTLGIGDAQGKSANASSTFTLTTPLQIPANTNKIVTIKADIAPIYTANTVAHSGRQIAIDYYGSTSTSENVGTGVSSGNEVANYSVTTAQTAAIIYKSVPTVASVALPTTTLSNSTMAISKFSVSADAKGDIDLYKFTFKIATTNPTTGGPIVVENLTLVDVTTPETTLYASTTKFYADISGYADIALLASPGTQNLSTTTRTVSAGTTRTFELRATISGTGAGAAINTQLEGDAAKVADTSGDMWTRDLVEADTNDDFIWSDLSDIDHTSTSFAAAVRDYTNGYLVNGLPSSNLTAQVLSR